MNLGRRGILALTFMLLCILVLPGELFFWRTSFARSATGGQSDSMGRAIDVYTGKEPYSGEGPDQESDAFEPQEEVILYALVTYNGDPVPGKIVVFDVRGPANSEENITLSLSGSTDDDGIANVSFVMPWPDPRPKVSMFGFWNVVASVDIAGVVVTDTLSFKVGWLVELLYIKTADVNNVLKDTFAKGERMGFRLGVRNMAMTEKNATFVVDASDGLGFTIGVIRLENEAVPPGEKEYFVRDVVVPLWAFVGMGRAVANAFKTVQSNVSVPWCPKVETAFSISSHVMVDDVAVLDVVPSVWEAVPGQPVNITVVVKNKGEAYESFNVSAYYDSMLTGTLWVEDLAPNALRVLWFVWLTGSVQPGEYRIRGAAGPVPGETSLADNVFIDGTVKIKLVPTPPVFEARWVLALLFILIVLVAALLVAAVLAFLTCRRRRKREEAVPERKAEEPAVVPYPPVKPYAPVKSCKACGREFAAVYTFCPHCMSFHGRDFE